MINVAPLVEARTLLNKGVDQILVQLKDTSLPLDERWDAYRALCDNNILVKNEGYGDGFLDTLGEELTMYDHFNVDKYQTMEFVDMYDKVMEADDKWHKDLVAVQPNIPAWQEKVLASGYSSFTYDW
jgi:hypothetical protein